MTKEIIPKLGIIFTPHGNFSPSWREVTYIQGQMQLRAKLARS